MIWLQRWEPRRSRPGSTFHLARNGAGKTLCGMMLLGHDGSGLTDVRDVAERLCKNCERWADAKGLLKEGG